MARVRIPQAFFSHSTVLTKLYLLFFWIRIRYVEWEKDPERKKIASALLKTKKFTPIPGEFYPSRRVHLD